MIQSKDEKISMGELRKEFEKIYPTAKDLHMNIIAEMMFRTDFKLVSERLGLHYDWYRKRHIVNAAKHILDKGN